MALPGFTAEASIGPTTHTYRVLDRYGVTLDAQLPAQSYDFEDDDGMEMIGEDDDGMEMVGEDDDFMEMNGDEDELEDAIREHFLRETD